jgi:hypothetical protein
MDHLRVLALYHDVVWWDFVKSCDVGVVISGVWAGELDALDVIKLLVSKIGVANYVDLALYDNAFESQSEYANSVHVACMGTCCMREHFV